MTRWLGTHQSELEGTSASEDLDTREPVSTFIDPGAEPGHWRLISHHQWSVARKASDAAIVEGLERNSERFEQVNRQLDALRPEAERIDRREQALRLSFASRFRWRERRSLAAETAVVHIELERLANAVAPLKEQADDLVKQQERINARVGADSRRVRRAFHIVSWLAVAVTVGVLIAEPLLVNGSVLKHPGSIHTGYYAAVAAVAPLLFIAGLAELIALRIPHPLPVLLNLCVVSAAATASALVALATDHSTGATFAISSYCLGMLLYLLASSAYQHAEIVGST